MEKLVTTGKPGIRSGVYEPGRDLLHLWQGWEPYGFRRWQILTSAVFVQGGRIMEDYLCLRCSHPMRCHGPGVSSCPATARPVCDLFKPTPSTRLTGGNARDVGRKDDKGKLRWGLVLEAMPKAIEAVVRLAEFGATRYGDHNWKQVDDPKRRYREALYRHTSALAAGEWLDADSGLPTLACIAWNALVLLEFGQ